MAFIIVTTSRRRILLVSSFSRADGCAGPGTEPNGPRPGGGGPYRRRCPADVRKEEGDGPMEQWPPDHAGQCGRRPGPGVGRGGAEVAGPGALEPESPTR